MHRRRLAALIAALALAVPSAAFAQSAGDEQYQDPFGGDQSQGSGGQSQGSGGQSQGSGGQSQGSANQSTQTPAQSGPGTTQTAQATPTPTPTSAPAPVAATAQTTPAAPQLPRTGENAVVVALAGAVLLAGGAALRRRITSSPAPRGDRNLHDA